MSAQADVSNLKATFGAAIESSIVFRDEQTVIVTLEALLSVLGTCKNELGYQMLLDISSIDHLGSEPRFEMVYQLASIDDSKRLRIKAKVSENQAVKSAVSLWEAADWHEREVWDLMGISFENHPNLKRILMWEGYPYHPLRKDFPLAGRETDMPDVAFTKVAPMEGGPFVTACGVVDSAKREPRALNLK